MTLSLFLALAQVGTPLAPPPVPAIGSETVVATGLRVPRPATTPCTVVLFAEREFQGEARAPIAYRPPAACPGPWAKVVFEGDFHVTAGEQYDRTGFVDLAGVNLFTGTTMEPRRTLAPRWHVERDVTDYAALFAGPRDGQALLTNYVDARYTGRVFWSGRLVFYPAAAGAPAPRTPDLVEALAPSPARIDAATPSVTRTLTFPRNVERLMVDVLAQPQADDEFWWLCQPPAPGKSDGCGKPFREAEVLIDDRLAGIAAAYPWIYTGGVSPRMWTLAAGVEALDLAPTRLDLTPFAALVNDGRPHRVTLRVAGVQRYFLGMATVLAWRDPGRAVVTGGLDAHRLVPAAPTIAGTPADDDDRFGDSLTSAARTGHVEGHVDTSRGRVTTRVDYRLRFTNRQQGAAGGGTIDQLSEVEVVRRIRGAGGTRRSAVTDRWPLRVEMAARTEGADRIADTHFRQGLDRVETDGAGRRITRLLVEPRVHSVAPGGDRRKATGQATTVSATRVEDAATGCYARAVTVTDGKIAAVAEGCAAVAPTP